MPKTNKTLEKQRKTKKHLAKFRKNRYDNFNDTKGGGLMSSIR
jgi:hypothetical protein